MLGLDIPQSSRTLISGSEEVACPASFTSIICLFEAEAMTYRLASGFLRKSKSDWSDECDSRLYVIYSDLV